MKRIILALSWFACTSCAWASGALSPPAKTVDIEYGFGVRMHLRDCGEVLCDTYVVANGRKMMVPKSVLSLIKRPMLESARIYIDPYSSKVDSVQITVQTYDPDDGSVQRTARLAFDANQFIELTDEAGYFWTIPDQDQTAH